MKNLLWILIFVCSSAQASLLGFFSVHQPLYLHGGDGEVQIQITEVPFVSSSSSPEAEFAAICRPFVPPSDGSWKSQGDVNLASLYNIKVGLEVASGSPEHWVVTIDRSAAKIPAGYPFSVEQVTDSVLTCVKIAKHAKPESERKLEIKIVDRTAK
jgi:hypothetical protein